MSTASEALKLVNRLITITERRIQKRKVKDNDNTVKTWRERFERAAATNDADEINRLLADVRGADGFRLPGTRSNTG